MNDRALFDPPPIDDVLPETMTALQAIGPGLLDLSRQQRNLLLLRPLFQLEIGKLRLGEELVDDKGLFYGIDTHYLALNALDLMMEATISNGCTRDEVIRHLETLVARMKPILSLAQRTRVAESVLDALDNKANAHREFVFEHFDAARLATRNVRFRLVTYQPDVEDVYRYRPTSEGYLVYLGMLDLAPEDSQELMEKMLDLLVQRGRFDAALDIARRARTLSIEYRQFIRDRLHQACRSPGSVNWARDMSDDLQRAREHVRQRQHEDQRMEESVLAALRDSDEPASRASLAQLLKVLQGAGLLRAQLVHDIGGAHDRFLDAQRSVFRARRLAGAPDLESRLFPQILDQPGATLVAAADEIIAALYPPSELHLVDLDTVRGLLMDRRAEEAASPVEQGEIVPHREPVVQFPAAVLQGVQRWLLAKFSLGRHWNLDELLDAAEDEGLDRRIRRCLSFVLYRAMSPTETEFKHMAVDLLGPFVRDVVQGTNLCFRPRQNSDDAIAPPSP